jgi:hypothetical protein
MNSPFARQQICAQLQHLQSSVFDKSINETLHRFISDSALAEMKDFKSLVKLQNLRDFHKQRVSANVVVRKTQRP